MAFALIRQLIGQIRSLWPRVRARLPSQPPPCRFPLRSRAVGGNENEELAERLHPFWTVKED